MIEVLSNGALNLVQDTGRPAHLGIGVSNSGAMDAPALQIANLLVGNDEGAAGIEICIFPFRVKLHQDAWFACTGAVTTVTLPLRSYPSWWAAHARAGDTITVTPPQHGSRAFLAFRGGIEVPRVLGSRATDIKSGFGGVDGRGLRKGDQLTLGPSADDVGLRSFGVAPVSRTRFIEELASGSVKVRAIAAAEYDEFTDEARAAFDGTEYQLTPDCNRQGYRLEGKVLKTSRPLELLSHGVVPGVVQVPPSGQPIVQMAEANTIGGYPKIATVIEADIWRLAQLRPGQRIRFELVDHPSGVAASRENLAEQQRLRDGLSLMARRP
ncbi:biotin-dependent carboxyltransferase family protein [Ramlibacter sp. WS9]|uniref:5-oxoprolinase subunit C family protein n=1 Tax=Ramlibacter sp. WS9 TaxID=1882741 RepID=UPI00114319C4|nr:biotin-dependent carboxyltransferase family protein [Ramlibacter sp. WS9]ROZ78035.1 biotin-dependent carboxyltransferase family protein [Ramlibacter sp. WS9]